MKLVLFALEMLADRVGCCKMETVEAENEVKGRPRIPDDGERRIEGGL